jgi:quinol monooxygenase YgiN
MTLQKTWLMLGAITVGTVAVHGGLALAKSKEAGMVVEYVRYEIPPAQHQRFIDAYAAAASALEASDHCQRYEISQGVEEPDHFTVRIEWDSVEGHERGFRGSAPFGRFLAEVKPFFGQIREMKHYQVLRQGVGAARG